MAKTRRQRGKPFGRGGKGRKYRGIGSLAYQQSKVEITVDSHGGVSVYPDPLLVEKGEFVTWESNRKFVLQFDGLVPEESGVKKHASSRGKLSLTLNRNMVGTKKKYFDYTLQFETFGIDPTIIWDPKRSQRPDR